MRFHLPLLLAGLLPVCAAVRATAQESDAAAASTSGAERPTSVLVSPGGVRRYEPGAWSVLRVTGNNLTDRDTEELIAVSFEDFPYLQFGRRFWLPAHSRRTTWLPVRVPLEIPRHRRQTQVEVRRLTREAGVEFFQREQSQTQLAEQPLTVDYETSKTGTIFRRPLPDESGTVPRLDWDAYEMAYKSRESAQNTRAMVHFESDFLPPFSRALESLDQIVLCGDDILQDSTGIENLRHWLQQGGRLWILLDRTGMQTVRAILGDAAGCEVVDRVELSDFTLEDLLSPRGVPTNDPWSADEPVEMLRVLTDSRDIHCRVAGWPAAFWQSVGRGEVLFTTLAPRGWMQNDGQPLQALASLGTRFYHPSDGDPLPVEVLKPLLDEQIGYRVPARWTVATILGVNTLGLFLAGVWLARRRRLEQLAWALPLLAVTATLLLVMLGGASTAVVPSTVALAQMIQVAPESNEAHVSSLAAAYSRSSGALDLAIERDALIAPEPMAAMGVVKRAVWDDGGRCTWENVTVSPGAVRYARTLRPMRFTSRVRARGRFGPNGLEGTLAHGDLQDVRDATIVALPAPVAAVSLRDDGSCFCGLRDVLAAGQFLSEGLLSDAQRRQQLLLRHLLNPALERRYGRTPSLLVWARPQDAGVRLPDDFQTTGAALVSIPLDIERTPPQTAFQVPATFIRNENFSGRRGSSAVFNPRTGQWLTQLTKPTFSELRFVLPEQVLPCRLERATLTVKINAPSRWLEIAVRVNGQSDEVETLHRLANPSGVLRFEIDRPELLKVDEAGGLFLAIVVTRTMQQIAQGMARTADITEAGPQDLGTSAEFDNSTWQIDYVRLDVSGRTL